MVVALTTENKILLGGMAAIFIAFALLSAFLIPRYRPDFPGRGVGYFVFACAVLFGAMMLSVEYFAVEEEEAHGGTATEASRGTTETGGGETTQPGGGANAIDVSATEFKFELAEGADGAGKYEFHLENKGQVPHNLVIDGPGVNDEATPVIDSGKSAELDVELQSGKYVLYCSVPGHRDAGMETKLEVE